MSHATTIKQFGSVPNHVFESLTKHAPTDVQSSTATEAESDAALQRLICERGSDTYVSPHALDGSIANLLKVINEPATKSAVVAPVECDPLEAMSSMESFAADQGMGVDEICATKTPAVEPAKPSPALYADADGNESDGNAIAGLLWCLAAMGIAAFVVAVLGNVFGWWQR